MPVKIDGTDITGATIDGTEVQEITVDGQTVFTAGPSNLPVAYSNLVAWYPFDSATYGGSNADDVTAILGGSGDDTAYDGTISGATYQSTGSFTDINKGANSGAFDFDGSNDYIDLGSNTFDFLNNQACSFSLWLNVDNITTTSHHVYDQKGVIVFRIDNNDLDVFVTGFGDDAASAPISTNTDIHAVLTYDGGTTQKLYVNGTLSDTSSGSMFDLTSLNRPVKIGSRWSGDEYYFDGLIDDVRIYDIELSASQISQIYQNTEP